MPTNTAVVQDALLASMQYVADPLADATVSAILGPWEEQYGASDTGQLKAVQATRWAKLAIVSAQMQQWESNGRLADWQPGNDLPPEIARALQNYLKAGSALPAWADTGKIARAEKLFYDYGVLSCTLLFCASLPECYVIPDLSAVLHAAGQLEAHTEYRIRSTAAMIFPVMLHGGLTDAQGSGIAQILKVRLIHATIRNLILRGSPEDAIQALNASGATRGMASAAALPALPELGSSDNLYKILLAHGWDTAKDGLPCNQEELAYTLLTFSYVFLQGMRKLGIGLSSEDEQAYLHTWNVVGHVLGIQDGLMAHGMEQSKALFDAMQARGRAAPVEPDPRPGLGRALINTMRRSIPLPLVKSFPVLLTRYLCGKQTARDLGIDGHVSLLARAVFAACMLLVRSLDWLLRLVIPRFSLASAITRFFGYQMISTLLLDQTRPLNLPTDLLGKINDTVRRWRNKR
jgi:hypothetical protein